MSDPSSEVVNNSQNQVHLAEEEAGPEEEEVVVNRHHSSSEFEMFDVNTLVSNKDKASEMLMGILQDSNEWFIDLIQKYAIQ